MNSNVSWSAKNKESKSTRLLFFFSSSLHWITLALGWSRKQNQRDHAQSGGDIGCGDPSNNLLEGVFANETVSLQRGEKDLEGL